MLSSWINLRITGIPTILWIWIPAVSIWFWCWESSQAEPPLPSLVQVDSSGQAITLLSPDPPVRVAVIRSQASSRAQIAVTGFNRDNKFKVISLSSPLRILIDLHIAIPSFKTVVLPINTASIRKLRLGHHLDKVRIVIEIQGTMNLKPEISYQSDGFVLSFGGDARSDKENSGKNTLDKDSGLEDRLKTAASSNTSAIDANETPSTQIDQNSDDHALLSASIQGAGHDAKLFMQGMDQYDSGNWSGAIRQLETLVDRYPESGFAEKAWFVLPEIYEKRNGDKQPFPFRQLADRYRDAVSRFPSSVYVPNAMLRIGNLYYHAKNYAEAQGYFNLAITASPSTSTTALSAKLQLARIFQLKKKNDQAYELLQSIISNSQDDSINADAMVEISKILYDQKAFEKSLETLVKVVNLDDDNRYRMPDIALYMGNNYFQLEQATQARKNFYHFYNSTPDFPDNHLLLARIGDTYLSDGRFQDAVRLFLFVCNRYPGTRGAVISWIRLAEQQDENSEVGSMIPLSSQQIYEKVTGFFIERQERDPLAMLAMLKLGVLHQKDKAYDQSLNALKSFFEYEPEGALLENGAHAMRNTLESILARASETDNAGQVIAIYERELDLMRKFLFSEPILLVVAKAYLELGQDENAAKLFEQLDASLSNEEKSEDLLYFLGRRLLQSGQIEQARGKLDILLKQYPTGRYAGPATLLLADVFYEKRQYREAMDMIDTALRYTLPRCEQARRFVQMANIALELGENKIAASAVNDAEKRYDACREIAGYLADEIGDLHIQLGQFDQAIAIFSKLSEMDQSQVSKASLKYKMAQCRNRQGRKTESLALYEDVAGMNDPFWSGLARENIASEQFKNEFRN